MVGSLGVVGSPLFTKLLQNIFVAATLTSRGSSNRDEVTPLPFMLCASQASHRVVHTILLRRNFMKYEGKVNMCRTGECQVNEAKQQ